MACQDAGNRGQDKRRETFVCKDRKDTGDERTEQVRCPTGLVLTDLVWRGLSCRSVRSHEAALLSFYSLDQNGLDQASTDVGTVLLTCDNFDFLEPELDALLFQSNLLLDLCFSYWR